MYLNRRQLIATGFAASLWYPIRACAAPASARLFTPESFGARGDGASDDYEALARLANAVNEAGGGTVALGEGRTYFVGRYATAGNGIADIAFSGCQDLTIEGNGATIATKGDFHRDQASTRGLTGLKLQDCRRVALRNLTLDGNVHRTTRDPHLAEGPSHGIAVQSCVDVGIEKVTARRFAGDGLHVRESKTQSANGTRAASRRFTVSNSQFLFNARQGLSIIQLREALFDNCDFSHTGFIEPGMRGSYGSHSPSAGVDVEPNNTPLLNKRVDVLTGEIRFRGCRMVGNGGASLVAAKFAKQQRFMEHIALHECLFECAPGQQGGRDGFIFDVPEGEVTSCTLRMADKTAYLGWYAQSDASFTFSENNIYGRNVGSRHPLIVVRRTRGAPTIRHNRLYLDLLDDAKHAAAMIVSNPKAVVWGNEVLKDESLPRTIRA